MDSKTLTTVLIVIVCALLLPVFIGIIGGIFGLIGSLIGGVFGLIGGLFGIVIGFIGSLFGAVFGFFGWLFGEPFHWHGPIHFLDGDVFAVILIIVLIVLMSGYKKIQ